MPVAPEAAAAPAPAPEALLTPRVPGDMRETAEAVLDAKQARQAKPRRPPTGSGEIGAAVAEAQRQLEEAGSAGAFARDPYRLALAGLSATIGTFPPVVRRIEGAVSSVVVELASLVQAVRHPLTDVERAALRRDVVEASRAGGREGVASAAAAIAASARAADRRTLALGFGSALLAVVITGAGCFWAGRSLAEDAAATRIRAERAEITLAQESLNLPLTEARAWLRLIRANPAIREAVSKAQNRQTSGAGQPFGLVPLWLDAMRTPPQTP